jgi:hypothetical protein
MPSSDGSQIPNGNDSTKDVAVAQQVHAAARRETTETQKQILRRSFGTDFQFCNLSPEPSRNLKSCTGFGFNLSEKGRVRRGSRMDATLSSADAPMMNVVGEKSENMFYYLNCTA